VLKKFSFWIVFVLIASVGAMVFIHREALQGLHQKTAKIHPLYQRQKILDSLTLSLERYRRMSASFRKFSSDDLAEVKNKLKNSFSEGVAQLDQLDPTPEERVSEHQLKDQLGELMRLSAHFEPLLFTKDAYLKPDVLDIHEAILNNLSKLGKSTSTRIQSLRSDTSDFESESMILLLGVGALIVIVSLCLLLRNHFVYFRPLKKLSAYAQDLKAGKAVPQNPPHFSGMYGEIQATLNQLALSVETHMRDRHKFILDIVADLKAPLKLLQSSQYLLGSQYDKPVSEEQQLLAAESVRRGLAIFSGSLDDLNDIVDINRLESRLEEKTVDLSELLLDVSRTVMGTDLGRRIGISVPPMPVWMQLDSRRFERVMVHILSKVLSTLPDQGGLTISVTQPNQGSFRGVEVLIQDTDRLKGGRMAPGGPEQDILKHWISENGLTLALAHKIIKAHGGTITASGVAGMSVAVMIRLPHERVVSRGLISPPSHEMNSGVKGLVVQRPTINSQGSII
jgi:signal transduction histidine kinase